MIAAVARLYGLAPSVVRQQTARDFFAMIEVLETEAEASQRKE